MAKSKKQRREAREARTAAQEERRAEQRERDADDFALARASGDAEIRDIEAARVEAAKEEFSLNARMAHILNRHRHGTGTSGKTEFPASWSDAKIATAVTSVCMIVKSISIDSKYGPYLQGIHDGVKIEVYFDKDTFDDYGDLQVSTAYPMVDPPRFVKNP